MQNAKIVFCLPINKEKLSLFAFDEQKQIDEVKRGCEAYQKLISEDFDKSALEDFDLEWKGDKMKDFKNCKKFVAFIDGNGYIKGKSGFYIVDVDTWNENQLLPKQANYMTEVYKTIENLGCKMLEENHFLVSKPIETALQLHEFLLPLHWIDAVDECEDSFYDPQSLDTFSNSVNLDLGDNDEGEIEI